MYDILRGSLQDGMDMRNESEKKKKKNEKE